MPGWHARTLDLQRAGKVQLAGIVEEQHPERAALFLQWQRMDWPVLVDSLNLLGVDRVPITLLLDEHGVVRAVNPPQDGIEGLLAKTFEAPAPPAGEKPSAAPDLTLTTADAAFVAGQAPLDDSIAAYRKLALETNVPEAHFRLGVALRRRHETSERQTGDFQAAIDAWSTALALRPNQYIWRRRLEQYGPRLEKPYAFYDWVDEARRAIVARGEQPVELRFEPRGAEIASPIKALAPVEPEKEPDPQGKIRRDEKRLVRVEAVVVPGASTKGRTARVHIALRPDAARDAHWNNEARPLAVWLSPVPGLELERSLLTAPNAASPASSEERRVELEVKLAGDAAASPPSLTGYVLYYVCEGKDGVCYFLRQDLTIEVDRTRRKP